MNSINITTAQIPGDKGYWELADLANLQQRCTSFGLQLEVLENTPHHFYDHIMTGGPKRDMQLDNYRTTLRNVAAAGIPVFGFHFMATGVWRTTLSAPIRGGATATAFDLDAAISGNVLALKSDLEDRYQADRIGRNGHGKSATSADEVWENYRIFLDAILPVAEEVGLSLAQHPDDPPVEEINGFARVFNSPENLRKAMQLANGSPAWGLNLCLGTVSEMIGGADAVHEVIAHFGPLGKIRYVHMRDVQGTVPKFQECFIGEGNYCPPAVLRQLKDVGFDGWLQDDHVPFMTEDSQYGHRARAHAIGYLQGILATLENRAS